MPGGEDKIVESDETYIGRVEGMPKARGGGGHKNAVLTLVERGGSARSFHLDNMKMEQIAPLVVQNVLRDSHLMTDEGPRQGDVGRARGQRQHTTTRIHPRPIRHPGIPSRVRGGAQVWCRCQDICRRRETM